MSITVRISESDEDAHRTFSRDEILIGRGPECDVRVQHPSVSLRHARIRREPREGEAQHMLVDLGSTNGTFMGGVRLLPNVPRLLRSGEAIQIGSISLEVSFESDDADGRAKATNELALEMVSRLMGEHGDPLVPSVVVVEGSEIGRTLPLSEDGMLVIVGRDSACTLRLSDRDVSRAHVCIFRREDGVYLRDLGSKNGSFLGLTRLGEQEVLWTPDRMLRVGRTVLALRPPDDWAVPLAEAPPPEEPAPVAGEPPAERLSLPPAPEVTRRTDPPSNGTQSRQEILLFVVGALALIAGVGALVWVLE